ncbi:Pnkp [Symbiodinium sp. CCMP2592]|nr:Pnkp [Symbiodinium sp. CCMP2592]
MDGLCGLAKRPAWREAAPSLLVREDPASKPTAKVAGFDLNDTLVSSKIGAPGYQVTVSDWIFYSEAVPRRIAELHDQGYRLVIFTNQGNIRSALDGKRAEAFKGYVDDFAKKLEVPCLVLASTQRDKDCKPNTGMWEHLAKVNGVAIDLAESFYIGDAAGEHSADDAEFAKAVGVRFMHARDYFGPAGGGSSEAGAAQGPPKKASPASAVWASGRLLREADLHRRLSARSAGCADSGGFAWLWQVDLRRTSWPTSRLRGQAGDALEA